MLNVGFDRSHLRAREDYLKAIYHLAGEGPVQAAELARYLGVSRSSVSQFKVRLAGERLIRRASERTDALRLTKKGLAMAIAIVRRHRLLETFLHRSLGVPLERIHDEAERLEHAVSEDVARRLARFLGNPQTDPHGHRIPDEALHVDASADRPLTGVERGCRVVLTRMDDRDEAVVKELARCGALPGLRAVVSRAGAGGMTLRSGRREIMLSAAASGALYCTLAPANSEARSR